MSDLVTSGYVSVVHPGYDKIPVWRDVERIMPHEGQECLVYAPYEGHDRPKILAVMTWTEFKGWWPGIGDRITHWMPAPQAPPRPRANR